MSRLAKKYQKEVVSQLMHELNLGSPLAVPAVRKVVLNVGVGRAIEDKTLLEKVLVELTKIAGQRAVPTLARKSVAGFKLRAGHQIGACVTLRGERMYEFLDKLFNAVLARTRDFRGLSLAGFDGTGNYTLGLSEQTSFLEIDPSQVDRLRGLQVTIVTSAKDDRQAEVLLRALGCPLEKKDKVRDPKHEVSNKSQTRNYKLAKSRT